MRYHYRKHFKNTKNTLRTIHSAFKNTKSAIHQTPTYGPTLRVLRGRYTTDPLAQIAPSRVHLDAALGTRRPRAALRNSRSFLVLCILCVLKRFRFFNDAAPKNSR